MKIKDPNRRLRLACYTSNVAMSGVACISPLLFVTFRQLYGVSYTLLGLLVVIGFCTQLIVDLLFAAFSKHFNYTYALRIMPILTVSGMLVYAICPMLLPDHAYLFLALGTFIFSASAGLNEVLISPVVAAIPSEKPERDMAILHSSYAWGLVFMVVICSVLLRLVKAEQWFVLPLLLATAPLVAFFLFATSEIPKMESGKVGASGKTGFSPALWLCVFCIFLGGAAEGTMTQWVSSYLEIAVEIPKTVGDILGMALFSVMLGLGRSLYAKFGKNALRVMLWGMVGATACYLIAGLSENPVVGLAACIFTGFCTSMLWPGSIILVGEKFPTAGVAAYALMAAGGDLGISVAPQLVGIVTDVVGASPTAVTLAERFSCTAEQIGIRAGLLSAVLFPLTGIFFVAFLKKRLAREESC
ncbi:MAG: MFS transporter [Ruminococcaceae bacterium]|nr:MFS transporter [Oscillospiraceae bacterium]